MQPLGEGTMVAPGKVADWRFSPMTRVEWERFVRRK